ncbi:ABC transporter permease [Dyadobacter beijingensis]|uniref:ABC transporter permease n=1 Tax=Dyadobacter beijingensis TaxID=365489 RepID=A0ABQ2HDN3_9BACT|nr:ABC transporter permease [Dyadobacter beijingensis]GGM74245.1 ABC transporter permease [Dyadobacter beijingensis]
MKANPQPTPPTWADKLLTWACASHLHESILGDLHEEFYFQAERIGERRARLRYWREALGFIKPRYIRRQKSPYPATFLFSHDMIRNYFTIAWRTLAHNKTYSFINIVGLSIGLAAAMLIVLYSKDDVSFDRFHTNNPRIYRVANRYMAPNGQQTGVTGISGYLPGPKFAAGVPEIQAYVRLMQEQHDIKTGAGIRSEIVFHTDSAFFSIFSFPLLSGNPATALNNPRSVVISEEMAQKQFGTSDALGKTLTVRTGEKNTGFEPYTVTGIAKTCPQNSSIRFDILMPLVVKPADMERSMNWFNTFLNTFVLLAPGSNLTQVERKINAVYNADAKEAIREVARKYDMRDKKEYLLQPFTNIHLNAGLPPDNGLEGRTNPQLAYILSGIAVFILLIACINFINLTVARSLKRAKEIGVRKVVGSGRMQLMAQFLGESFLLCSAAFALGLVLVQAALPTFNHLANKALAISYLFDIKLMMGYLVLFLATGLLAGFYPALVLSGYSPVKTLYNRLQLSGKNYLQTSLVVLQFAIASFLIVGTLTIYAQFDYLTSKDLGYNDKHLVSVDKQNLTREEAFRLRQELGKDPNIIAVAPKNAGRWNTSAKVNGNTEIAFTIEAVDPEFLPAIEVPVRMGRNFSHAFPADSTHSVLVNEAFVKQAGWKNPIGQIVDFWYDNARYTVVGVTRDYHYTDLNEKIGPQVFTMKHDIPYGRFLVKIKPGTETGSLRHIAATYARLFPLNAYTYKFMDDENLKKYESEAKWKQIMLFSTMLTIFISCIGLFGLATLSAERRTKEIGIRKVLGASVNSIVHLLTSDFLKLVCISFIFAFPMAWYAIDKWLQNYPYRIDISALTFIQAGLLAVSVAVVTVSFQSIRAALMNPVESLGNE